MSEQQQETAVSIRDCAISFFARELRTAAESIPDEILRMDQEELEQKRTPNDVDYLLKKRLWTLIESARKGSVERIICSDIFPGICSRQAFYKAIANPLRLAWLLHPPVHDRDLLEAGLRIGLKNLLRFVSKEPNADTILPFLKAVELLFNRVYGPVVHRIDARHAHAHLSVEAKAESPEDVEKRLAELRAKLVGSVDV